MDKYMKRYYARIETEVGVCTVVVKHKSVKNVDDAKKRLIVNKDFRFSPEQILSISECRELTIDMVPENIDSLINVFDGLIKYQNEGVSIG
jgi:hypothetical protein